MKCSARSMNEFKFACPVCGQHMMCDASHGGSVMECPTCFQKIVAPQAPSPDSKFILTGTMLTDKKITIQDLGGYPAAPAPKRFPGVLAVALILVFMGAAAAAIYWATILHPRQKAAGNPPPITSPVASPGPVAPPADDSLWMLALTTNAIPDSPVAGRIHGQDFLMERAIFQKGTLTLRHGRKGPVESAAQISFGGALAESLAGRALHILAETNKSAAIQLRWKDDAGTVQREKFDSNYAMRLEFGSMQNRKLPGKIWLCTPDPEKSYLLGSFQAEVRN